MLDDSSPRIADLENLWPLCHEILCEHNELEVNAFPMTERILVCSGNPCGLYFCLHGPRSVKLTAMGNRPQLRVVVQFLRRAQALPSTAEPRAQLGLRSSVG